MKRRPDTRVTERMQADREELVDRIGRWLPQDGRAQPYAGLNFGRYSLAGEHGYGIYPPAFCVIAQGSKQVRLGDEVFRYDPAHYLITTMDLPLAWEVVEASSDQPYLTFVMALDPAVVTSV